VLFVSRFRVKFHVTNGSGDATFVLFDGHMNYLVGEHCVGLVSAANVVVVIFCLILVSFLVLFSIVMIYFSYFRLGMVVVILLNY
jgi:hypothetical protein